MTDELDYKHAPPEQFIALKIRVAVVPTEAGMCQVVIDCLDRTFEIRDCAAEVSFDPRGADESITIAITTNGALRRFFNEQMKRN